MSLRSTLGRLPLVRPVARALRGRGPGRHAALAAAFAEVPGGSGAAAALRALAEPDPPVIAKIEAERARLAADPSPLDPAEPDGHTVAKVCGASKSAADARLLYELAKAAGPGPILEMGTNVGISAAYLAAGRAAAGVAGPVVTLEGSKHRQDIARGVHANLGLGGVEYVLGYFDDTLGPTLAGFGERGGRIPLAFIDGNHRHEPTLAYFEQVRPHLTPNAVVLFDDVRWSDGMERAWAELQRNRAFAAAAEIAGMGLCVMGGGDGPPRVLGGSR